MPIKGRFLGRLLRCQNGKMSRRAHHLLKFDNRQHLPVSPHLKLSAYNHAQALIYRAISPIQAHCLYLYQIPLKHSTLYCQLMREYAQRLRALVRQSAVLLVGVFYNSIFSPMPLFRFLKNAITSAVRYFFFGARGRESPNVVGKPGNLIKV